VFRIGTSTSGGTTKLGSAHLITELLQKENALYVTLEHGTIKPTPSSQVSPEQEMHSNREPVTLR
jgi:hypothetical protein